MVVTLLPFVARTGMPVLLPRVHQGRHMDGVSLLECVVALSNDPKLTVVAQHLVPGYRTYRLCSACFLGGYRSTDEWKLEVVKPTVEAECSTCRQRIHPWTA